MNRLIIIGAGGFGREVLAWARSHTDYGRRWVIGGFLDDNATALDSFNLGLSVIGSLREYKPRATDLFICAAESPVERYEAHKTVSAKGGVLSCLVHPTAVVSERAQLATGIIICPFAIVAADAQVHEGSVICSHAFVGHDAIVGAFSRISAHCHIAAGAVVGNQVLVGSHAIITADMRISDRAVVEVGAVMFNADPRHHTDNLISLAKPKKAEKLVIIGAGGAGVEALWVAQRMLAAGGAPFNGIHGFVDDNPRLKGEFLDGLPVLGTLAEILRKFGPADFGFHCALGKNQQRQKAAEIMEAKGWQALSLIDPSAIIAETAEVGEGSYIGPLSIVAPHARVGRHALINTHVGVGHHAVIGDYVQLCPGVRVNGGCKVDKGALLGSNAVVHPGQTIGEGATIGANSFVIRSVKPRFSMLGVPARIVSRPAENGPNAQA